MKNNLFFIVLLLVIINCPKRQALFVPVLLEYKLYYPDEARKQGLEGKVIVGVLVDELGRSKDVKIAKSSGNYLLDSAAVYTAKTFIFSPAMQGDKAVKAWVIIPVEFNLEMTDPEIWLAEVKILQKGIAKEYNEDRVKDLYNLYKQIIYAPKGKIDITINEYIKQAVLDTTNKLWEKFWSVYPASVILFVDIIYRYPDSFTNFVAKQELGDYLEKEALTIKNTISQPGADSIINRLHRILEE